MKYIFLLFTCLLLIILSSCVTTPLKFTVPDQYDEPARNEIVQYAESLLGIRDLSQINGWFRNDCSGYVIGVYKTLGYRVKLFPHPYANKISHALYYSLNKRGLTYTSGTPKRADVVFFKGTFDGAGDKVSHVGIVADIFRDETIRILNYTSKGVTELRMNLVTPSIHTDHSGNVVNDFLKKKDSLIENERLLSGELFYSFGDLHRYTRF